MQTRITARHFRAGDTIRDHVDKRMMKLQRYYDGITDVHVILDKGSEAVNGKSAEIALKVYRQTLTATEAASTHQEAIDRCVDQLRRQLLRYKAKLRSKQRNGFK